MIAPYRRFHLPFQWWLVPGIEPAGLRRSLEQIGMHSWSGATSMALDLHGWRPEFPVPAANALLFEAVQDQDRRAVLDIVCNVFFVPHGPMERWTIANRTFRLYVARLGDQPKAALATLERDGVVGVYHVATLPDARRLGLAGNLLILALRMAMANGCTLATLTATPEARHLYEVLGFSPCGIMEQWIPGPELSVAIMQGRDYPMTGGHRRF